MRLAVVIVLLLPLALLGGCGRWRQEVNGQVVDPVRVRVPIIGVDAAVQPLTVDDNGVLPPPDNFDDAGWWSDGPEPGERGPAVIAEHLDSYRGPAVFSRLKDLERGDTIFVDRAEVHGRRVRHRADRAARQGRLPRPTPYTAPPRTPSFASSPAAENSISDTADTSTTSSCMQSGSGDPGSV